MAGHSELVRNRPGVLAVVAWLVAFAVISVGVAAWLGASPGRDDAPPLTRSGRQLVPNNANARVQGEAIVVANRRESPLTILAISQQPLRASDYGRLVVDADPLPRGVEAALIWVRAGEAGRANDQHLLTDRRGAIEPALVDRDPAWRGDITFLAIGIKGPMESPWTLRSLRVEPVTVGAVLADMIGGWKSFERWDGRSINVLFGGRDEQRAWLPPLAFAAALAAAVAAIVIARKRRQDASVAVVVAFLFAWLILDLRWQWNLALQARETGAEFGGRDWAQKHAVMEDGELFRFVQAALAKLPAEPVRIFVNSDYEYFRRRAGYHLYPHNVLAYSWAEPSQLRPGEYLLLYQKADVRFDTAAQELRWANGRELDAVPLLVQRGAGLFKVGPKGGR